MSTKNVFTVATSAFRIQDFDGPASRWEAPGGLLDPLGLEIRSQRLLVPGPQERNNQQHTAGDDFIRVTSTGRRENKSHDLLVEGHMTVWVSLSQHERWEA